MDNFDNEQPKPKKYHPGMENLRPVKPGEVRNKYGRAGKDGLGGQTKKTLKHLLESKLNEIDPTTGKSQSELIIEVLIRNAKRGDFRHLDMVFDRTVGKAPQYVEQNITGNGLGVVILPQKDDVIDVDGTESMEE